MIMYLKEFILCNVVKGIQIWTEILCKFLFWLLFLAKTFDKKTGPSVLCLQTQILLVEEK